jgi:osmotically-inducible protein OsmY
VQIKGDVSSWAEHDEAVDAAWLAPGVTHVDDQIRIAY